MVPLRDHLPTRTVPLVNYFLIMANVAAFFLERSAMADGVEPSALLSSWGLVPARLLVEPVTAIETVFSSMFMHDPTNLMHIGSNMLFLWIFGDNVEDAMGHVRYLAFYLLGGVCAAVAQMLVDPSSTVPMVGASGAISAVLAAYVFLYPSSPITVINPIPLLWFFWGLFLYFPAWLVIGEFFLLNLWSALANTAQGGGVAFTAHVGGFIAGAVLWRAFSAGRLRVDDYGRWRQWARRSRQDEGWR